MRRVLRFPNLFWKARAILHGFWNLRVDESRDRATVWRSVLAAVREKAASPFSSDDIRDVGISAVLFPLGEDESLQLVALLECAGRAAIHARRANEREEIAALE